MPKQTNKGSTLNIDSDTVDNRGQTAATSIKRLRRNTDFLLTFSNQEIGAALGDNTLMTTIFEVQAQRIASSLRDLLVNLRFD
jgi:cell division GTPase FtsZ